MEPMFRFVIRLRTHVLHLIHTFFYLLNIRRHSAVNDLESVTNRSCNPHLLHNTPFHSHIHLHTHTYSTHTHTHTFLHTYFLYSNVYALWYWLWMHFSFLYITKFFIIKFHCSSVFTTRNVGFSWGPLMNLIQRKGRRNQTIYGDLKQKRHTVI